MTLHLLLACLMLVTACGSKHDDDDDSAAAVENGVYDSSPMTCRSTAQPPPCSSASQMMVLGAFAELTAHTWALSGGELRETFQDADCKLTVIKTVNSNSGSSFSTTQARHYLWEPEGCRLAVVYVDVSYPAGQNLSTYFTDNDNKTTDIPWDIERSGVTSVMRTRNGSPWDTLWQPYGCALPDQIVISLTKKG